jgi:hypothetical protein
LTVADQNPTRPQGNTGQGGGPRTGPVLAVLGVLMFASSAGTCAVAPALVDNPSLHPAYTLLVMLSLGGAALTAIGLVATVLELLVASLRRR